MKYKKVFKDLIKNRVKWLPFTVSTIVGLAVLIPVAFPFDEDRFASRSAMLVFFFFLFIVDRYTSPIWFTFPLLLIGYRGKRILHIFSFSVIGWVWVLSGIILIAAWATRLRIAGEKRYEKIIMPFGSITKTPMSVLLRYHAPSWFLLAPLVVGYGIFLPQCKGIPMEVNLKNALIGLIASVILASITSEYRFFTIFFLSPFVAIAMGKEGYEALTYLCFNWWGGYVVACLMRDLSSTHGAHLEKEQDRPTVLGKLWKRYKPKRKITRNKQPKKKRLPHSRRPSAYPREPRTYGLRKGVIIFINVVSTLMIFPSIAIAVGYFKGEQTGGALVFLLFLMPSVIWGVIYVNSIKWSIDEQKIRVTYGIFYCREYYFSEVNETDMKSRVLVVGRKNLLVNIKHVDHTLIYLRLLEEMRYRKIKISYVDCNSAQWNKAARFRLKFLADLIYEKHQAYYDSHPQELEYLNSLTQLPSSYGSLPEKDESYEDILQSIYEEEE